MFATQQPIHVFMTPAPHSIGQDQNIEYAAERMRELQIRHLPVLKGGKLVGILSDRDIASVQAMGKLDSTETTVEEAMTPEPFTIGPHAPIAGVLRVMAKHRYGCAVILDGKKVIGIFTTTDAVHLLAEALDSGSLSGQGELSPSEVRARVLAEHAVIRRMLDKTRLSAEAAHNDPSTESLKSMHIHALELFSTMGRHFELQERLLAPALREADGFGKERHRELLEEIETQRNVLHNCEAQTKEPTKETAAIVLHYTDSILDQLKREETKRLTPELLRDDLIQVSFSG